MSGNDTNGATPMTSSQFTEREIQILGWAMQSLKSGPPDIDYERLAGFAGMSNTRSASNAWSKIKNKLMVGEVTVLAKPAAKGVAKKKGTAKTKSEAVGEDDGDANCAVDELPKTPKKTPRKRTAKKQEVDGDAGSPSPKKKGRPAKGKKAAEEAEVGEEADDGQDLRLTTDNAANGDAIDDAEKPTEKET
ncbi:uncharacterized protein BDR25DRAFT_329369 [Lindgomyces ingoldianus]|uniref:Uncharacterized protein n=1 Tax=Lindgomyces ingoldianus TaxID=673940 RepID=A0ACB6QCI2_9PLEO|nr:uncharacterized protein BDR25DRAFT_329369 [Lindgomyces ingoldianus]KAF2464082.1 hypothetical protein BDR25DRAFT_329369 [Lindgomyces ingoldianus]